MRKLPLHPILFALSPILFFYSYNKTELSLTDGDFLLSLALSATLAFIFWVFLAKVIIKNSQKAAITTSLAIVLFFTYGHIEGFIKNLNFNLGGIEIGPDKVLLSAWGAIFLVGSYLTLRAKSLKRVGAFFNFVAATSIILSLANIVPYEIETALTNWSAKSGDSPSAQDTIPTNSSLNLSNKPDIYYLIFDRYANNVSLKNHFDFDNSKFTSYLEETGFFVARESFANYPRTFNSLASSLNMEYLDQLTENYGEKYGSLKPMYEMIENNKVVEFLKEIDYKYIHISSWYPGTKKNKNADITFNYQTGIQSNFLNKLIESTALGPILQKFFRDDPFRESSRRGTLYQFEKLDESVAIEDPKFVFAHFLIPHEPYVFDQDGNSITEEEADKNTMEENYINQLIFTNQKIKEFVEKLISKSENPPVVIIQSDEGPITEGWSKTAQNITDEGFKTHIRIFNAYYLPSTDQKSLYPSITPVNTFRLIFSNYFEADFPLLPDKSYIFQDVKHLFKFIDVTDKVSFE